jgi:hypothetical protein
LATADDRINGYFWGDFVEAVNQANEVHYPLMLVTPQPGNIGEKSITYSFLIGLMDKYEQGNQRQLTEVHSDMHRIIVDVVRVIKNSYRWNSYGEIQLTVGTQPFIERGQDFVAGWTLSVSLRVFENENICEIPLTDYDLQTASNEPDTCDPATVVNSDLSFIQFVGSGQTYTLADYEFEFQDANGNVLSTEFTPAMIGDTFIVGAGGACPTTFSYDLYVNGVFQEVVTVDVNDNINIIVS